MIQQRQKALISACLIGELCRYDGGHAYDSKVEQLSKDYDLIPVCPEQMGGFSTPRPTAEIRGGDGKDVLDGKAKVERIQDDEDLTDAFCVGAQKALDIARQNDIRIAFLKSRSPSCGNGCIVVQGKEIPGDGVTTALLKRNGISVATLPGNR